MFHAQGTCSNLGTVHHCAACPCIGMCTTLLSMRLQSRSHCRVLRGIQARAVHVCVLPTRSSHESVSAQQVPELEGVRATIALEDLSSSGTDDARDRVQPGATLAARCAPPCALDAASEPLHNRSGHLMAMCSPRISHSCLV